MFLLAVNAAIAISAGNGPQAARLTVRESAAWKLIRPSIVTLQSGGAPSGVAALVDDSGYFVAHLGGPLTMPLVGVTDDGKSIPFTYVSKDTATQLVLLKTSAWVAGSARVFHAPNQQDPESGPLIAILPTGPMKMAYVSRHRYGVLNPSRRLVPLTEIHFEFGQQAVGGALIVTESGELLGSLNATLASQDNQYSPGAAGQNQQTTSAGQSNNVGGLQGGAGGFGGRGGGGIGGGGARPFNNSVQNSNQGPGQLAVAYTVGPEVVRHALEGFLSSTHQVEYAALGIFCTDNPGGGALIQQVTPGSPAAKVGLKPGDVLQSIGPNPIADQVAFASVMLQQKVGKEIALMIHRRHATLVIDIVPERAAN